LVAEIVINSPASELGRIFDYNIPSDIGTVTVGSRVTVPFGLGNNIVDGFVVNVKESSTISRLKSIINVTEDSINPKDFKIAEFIAKKYFCNLGCALNLFCIDKVKCQKSKEFNFDRTEDFLANEEQQEAINKFKIAIDQEKFREFLLYGVTGSGKTEVYLQTVKYLASQGKGAIVLVPEISLTPQTVRRFVERLGNKVAVIHSRLTKGQKYEQWLKIKNGEALVVVGARSALFTPVHNLSAIILDEEHDASYKSGQTPLYHAREVAEEMGKIHDAIVILGSATPDVTTYYRTTIGEIEKVSLTKRANESILPDVNIVNMSNELMDGNKMIFSRSLHAEIKKNIENHEQTILFLNRRGHSSFVSCRACGFVAKCKNCNIALTYHQDENKLMCHYCGLKYNNFTLCPVCKSPYIKHFGIGTEKVESFIKQIFPEASVIRMDLDTTSKRESHELLLKKFRDENIDILVGTQMIAKGHDFPNVTLVGVIAADISLNVNDYRASERTFNLLTQVSGRAGRGEKKGRVIIQTYESENYSIVLAGQQNYEAFYNQEIIVREQLNYPPFCDIIISVSSNSEEIAVKSSNVVKDMFYDVLGGWEGVQVLNAVPAPLSKINGKFRWRVIIKCKINDEINNIINNLIKSKKFVKMKDADITIDVNPVTSN